jgi:hypothetical protein
VSVDPDEQSFAQRAASRQQRNIAGTLVIVSRNKVTEWEGALAQQGTLSFHSYTEPLSRRRGVSSRKLLQFDVVLTTHEIVRAKEVCVPIQVRKWNFAWQIYRDHREMHTGSDETV